MGLEAEKSGEEAASRLIAAGRAFLAQGDPNFSLTRLCAEAGVTLEEFRASFASKAELLAQLSEASPKPDASGATDPWLERRLRVFERALMALEEKADKRDREQRQVIAQLEEKLSALPATPLFRDRRATRRGPAPMEAAQAPGKTDPETADGSALQSPAAGEAAADKSAPEPNPLLLTPLEPEPVPKIDSEFLEAGRRAAQAHARTLADARPRPRISNRMLVAGAVAILTLLVCAALTLGHANYAGAAPAQGTARRIAAMTPLEKLRARADSGDVRAENALALAYLRGDGVAKDMTAAARWAEAAAQAGEPEAQYLIGSLSRDGAGVARDPGRAFAWFAKAAAAGNLKAMHNLAIAYIEGVGTARDASAGAAWFAKAAARGYVDSAFDLAVLYEKGQGVPQDARAALHWYKIAAAAGDAQAAVRAGTLAEQVHL